MCEGKKIYKVLICTQQSRKKWEVVSICHNCKKKNRENVTIATLIQLYTSNI